MPHIMNEITRDVAFIAGSMEAGLTVEVTGTERVIFIRSHVRGYNVGIGYSDGRTAYERIIEMLHVTLTGGYYAD